MFGSLSDSSLGSWSFNLQVLGIAGVVAALVSVVGMHWVNSELSARAQRRSSAVEAPPAARPAPAVQIQLSKTPEKPAEPLPVAAPPPQPAPQPPPREITEEQRRNFISELADAPKRPLPVLVYENDPEILAYADQIRVMLVLAGYDSGPAVRTNFTKPVSLPGLLIVVKDPARAPAFTGAIQNAFKAVGIEALGAKDVNFGDGDAAVIVGRRKSN